VAVAVGLLAFIAFANPQAIVSFTFETLTFPQTIQTLTFYALTMAITVSLLTFITSTYSQTFFRFTFEALTLPVANIPSIAFNTVAVTITASLLALEATAN
jgi:hypothetical protein